MMSRHFQMRQCTPVSLFGIAVSIVFSLACGGQDAAQTAAKCAESDLVAQCPPGITPELTASATSQCSVRRQTWLSNPELSPVHVRVQETAGFFVIFRRLVFAE